MKSLPSHGIIIKIPSMVMGESIRFLASYVEKTSIKVVHSIFCCPFKIPSFLEQLWANNVPIHSNSFQSRLFNPLNPPNRWVAPDTPHRVENC
jgi:hypothetical protein